MYLTAIQRPKADKLMNIQHICAIFTANLLMQKPIKLLDKLYL